MDNHAFAIRKNELVPGQVIVKFDLYEYGLSWGAALEAGQNLLYSLSGRRNLWPITLVGPDDLLVDKLGPETYLLKPKGFGQAVDLSHADAQRIAKGLIAVAHQVEELIKMLKIIEDQKLLVSKGVPLLLTLKPKALLEAQKAAGMSIPSGTIVSPPKVTLLGPNGVPVTKPVPKNRRPKKS